MDELTITTYKADDFEQITISAPYTDRRALLTRHKGRRTWAVRGRFELGPYGMEITPNCRKSDALYAAKFFVAFG